MNQALPSSPGKPNKPNMEGKEISDEILKKLLEGQNRIAEDIRSNMADQKRLERQSENAKANLFTLTNKVSEVFTTQTEVIEALDFNCDDIHALRNEVKDNVNEFNRYKEENQDIRSILYKIIERLDVLERKHLDLSLEVKAKSVVINGLSETQKEDTLLRVFGFLHDIDKDLVKEDIDICYRVGAAELGAPPRSIIVTFMSLAKKRRLMTIKNSLKDHKDYSKVYVNDDLPPELRKKRENLREIAKYAEEHGYKSKVSGNKLIVNGETYLPHELDLLPNDILPERVKTRRRGNGIAFQGETAYFSNFYPCQVVFEGLKFNCSEQAYQYTKAIAVNKEGSAHKIKMLSDPQEIKHKGDKLPTTPGWEAQKLSVMENIVYHKFMQNAVLKNKLCDTMDLPLYESTTNLFWGCGLRLNARQWNSGIFPGKNHMGEILMRTRTKLQDGRKSRASVSASPMQSSFSPDVRPQNMGQEQPGSTQSRAENKTSYEPVADALGSSMSSKTGKVDPEEAAYPHDANQHAAGSADGQSAAMETEEIPTSIQDGFPVSTETHVSESVGCDQQNDSNLSIVSSGSSFKDFMTNGEFDIAKVQSWSLPSVRRRTREWLSSSANKSRHRPYNTKDRKAHENVNVPLSTSTPGMSDHSNFRVQSRSFTNSNFKHQQQQQKQQQQQQHKKHGFDADPDYEKTIIHNPSLMDNEYKFNK